MEEAEISQIYPVKSEVNDDTEDAVEVRLPCLICGIDLEIDHFQQEVDQSDEELDWSEGDGRVNHNVFHWFLKWFKVEIVKKGKQRVIDLGWDGEGGDILRFCGNCKKELERVLELQKELGELEKKLKNGLGEVKGKMERSEEAVQSTGIYERDPRYKMVRSRIVKHGKFLIASRLTFVGLGLK